MGGLAVAIGVAMIVMVTVPVIVLVLVAKRFGTAAMVGALLVGLVIGVLAVSATFFESSWSPPMRVVLEGQTSEQQIVVVTDEKAPPIEVTGLSLPFMRQTAVLRVAPNGLVRVKSVAPIYGQPLDVTNEGRTTSGVAGMGDAMVFDFNPSPEYVDYKELIKKRLAQ